MPPPNNTPAAPVDQFKQAVERLKGANNVLVTVSANPSVDQLAACIGLTLALNKIGKHATAVFSGSVPSTIEFLEPEKTLEKNTDSLRDFIIALDKSKADKLRYKVDNENQVVKIFITPYRTSLSEKDLDFSQGDFNVDAVVALGVHDKTDLDAAIVAHGRILHDAAVISVSNSVSSELGAFQWRNGAASSLCEMVSDLTAELGKGLFDVQIATALLTGIVAETDRFSNEKASPHTMSVSGTLMSAGASQQLVATKLEEKPPEPAPEEKNEEETPEEAKEEEKKPESDGTIQIDHDEIIPPVVELEEEDPDKDDIHIDEHGKLLKLEEKKMLGDEPESEEDSQPAIKPSSMILEPPSMGGRLTANSVAENEQYDSASVNPLNPSASEQPMLLGRDNPLGGGATPLSASMPPLSPILPPDNGTGVDSSQTLSQIEDEVGRVTTPDITGVQATGESAAVPLPPPIDDVREKVEQIINTSDDVRPQPPLQSTGSTSVDLEINHDSDTSPPPVDQAPASPSTPPPPSVPPPMMPPPAV